MGCEVMSLKAGRRARTPKGFKDSLKVCGRTLKINYYLSIKDLNDKKVKIDACIPSSGEGEIWIATRGRSREYIADSLWHELKHYIFRYMNDYQLSLDDDLEETIILLQEMVEPAVFRENQWFHLLFAKT